MTERRTNGQITKVFDRKFVAVYDTRSDILDLRLSDVKSMLGLGEDEVFPYIAQWFGQEGETEAEDIVQGCMIWSWVENGSRYAKDTLHYIAQKTGWDVEELTKLAHDAVEPYRHAA